MNTATQIPNLAPTLAHKYQPVVAIVSSLAAILLIGFTFYSLHLQIKHTNLQLEKLEKENECKK